VFANGLFEALQTGLLNELILVLPLVITDQVVLETPEADAISAEDITGFDAVSQRPVDQKFIAVGPQASLSTRIHFIQITLGRVGDKMLG
jgi:hypothetical protein